MQEAEIAQFLCAIPPHIYAIVTFGLLYFQVMIMNHDDYFFNLCWRNPIIIAKASCSVPEEKCLMVKMKFRMTEECGS